MIISSILVDTGGRGREAWVASDAMRSLGPPPGWPRGIGDPYLSPGGPNQAPWVSQRPACIWASHSAATWTSRPPACIWATHSAAPWALSISGRPQSAPIVISAACKYSSSSFLPSRRHILSLICSWAAQSRPEVSSMARWPSGEWPM